MTATPNSKADLERANEARDILKKATIYFAKLSAQCTHLWPNTKASSGSPASSEILRIQRSGYYAWKAVPKCALHRSTSNWKLIYVYGSCGGSELEHGRCQRFIRKIFDNLNSLFA